MDIFNFLIGFVLGLLGSLFIKKVTSFLQVIFCFGTSFLFIKIFHHDIVLRSIYEWTWYNLFNGYNFWFLSIIGFLVSYLIFYSLIPKIIRHLIIDKVENRFNLIFENISKVELKDVKRICIKVIKCIVKIYLKIEWKKLQQIKYNEFNFQYHDYINYINTSFVISIHLVINWLIFFGLNLYILIPIIFVVILIGFFLLLFPISKKILNFILKFYIYEHNRNIK